MTTRTSQERNEAMRLLGWQKSSLVRWRAPGVVARWYGDQWLIFRHYTSEKRIWAHARLDFIPTPQEARAALALSPGNGTSKAPMYSREQIERYMHKSEHEKVKQQTNAKEYDDFHVIHQAISKAPHCAHCGNAINEDHGQPFEQFLAERKSKPKPVVPSTIEVGDLVHVRAHLGEDWPEECTGIARVVNRHYVAMSSRVLLDGRKMVRDYTFNSVRCTMLKKREEL